jgi:hypothetical protein
MTDTKPTLDDARPNPAASSSFHFKPTPTQGPVLRWVEIVSLLAVLAGAFFVAYMLWFLRDLGP